MELSFTHVLNLSISASWLVLAVMLLRPVLKHAPKGLRCALWALVAIRLLCPVSIESNVSLIPSREIIPEHYLLMEPVEQDTPAKLEIVTNPVYPDAVQLDTQTTVARVQNWDLFATLVWLTGMGAMGIYAAYSHLTVRLRVRMAGWVRENLWECDELDSPFILGLLRPRIYLPSSLDDGTRAHVLAHERAHLRRLDHLWKPLGFVLLSVHWFNPVMWLAYILLCRDIELACDERVIRGMDKEHVRSYSEALIACSVSHRMIAACPLAFGEVGVGSRIKSMLSYKKPGFWVLLTGVVLSIVLAVCFLTDPVTQAPTLGDIQNQDGFTITNLEMAYLPIRIEKQKLPDSVLDGKQYFFAPEDIPVWDSESTRIFVRLAQLRGDKLALFCEFEHVLPDCGTILLPYDPLDPSTFFNAADLVSYDVTDSSGTYPGGASLHMQDVNGFTLEIDTEVFSQVRDYLEFDMTQLYSVSYVADSSPLSDLLNRPMVIEEVLYTNPSDSFSYTAEDSPVFEILNNLTLMAEIKSGPTTEYSPSGKLLPVELTAEDFDDLFLPEGWTENHPSARSLRWGNEQAWRSVGYYMEYLLLAQRDGSIYLALLPEQGDYIANLYALTDEAVLSAPRDPSYTTYALRGGSIYTPSFRLCSDGTFTLTTSPLSSYLGYGSYVLENGVLNLSTSDGYYSWYFREDDSGAYHFDAQSSDPIYCLTMEGEYLDVPDGTAFLPEESGPVIDFLESAISGAIRAEHRGGEPTDHICAEAHRILFAETVSATPLLGELDHRELTRVYLLVRYQEFDGDLELVLDDCSPVVLTFESGGSSYELTAYETAGIDSEEIEELFPADVLTDLIEHEGVYAPELGIQCSEQARQQYEEQRSLEEAAQQELIRETIERICASPAQSSAPGAYIDAHQEEYDRLVSQGDLVVWYCFGQFAEGNQMGLEGHIMALLCQDILAPIDPDAVIEGYMTGQAWFNQYASDSEALRTELGTEEFEKLHIYRALALHLLGI